MLSSPSASPPDVCIRLPRAAQVYIAAFGAVWCGFVTFGLVETLAHRTAAAIIPAGMLAFGATLIYRLFRLSAVARGDTLVVRNHFATKRLTRADIEGFRIGPASNQPFAQTIHLLLTNNSVLPIDAAARRYATRRGKVQLAQRQASLAAWLSDA